MEELGPSTAQQRQAPIKKGKLKQRSTAIKHASLQHDPTVGCITTERPHDEHCQALNPFVHVFTFMLTSVCFPNAFRALIR